MSTPIENLLKLQEAARDGAVSPEVAAWFSQGIEDYLSRQGPLDECLNLTGKVGQRKALTIYLAHTRNYHLKQAWELLEADSPWQRSVCLAEEVLRFETRIWTRWSDLPEPPIGSSELRSHLFHAFRTGIDIPGLSQLHTICTTQ